MKIYNTPSKFYNRPVLSSNMTNPNFCAMISSQSLKHANIGMMENGIIGRVGVLKNGKETFLNVVKSAGASGQETYMLKDMLGKIVGEMDIKIEKASAYGDKISHVFVEHLANHSRPNTEEFVSGIPHYQGVGTRLLQIAQRRSDESGCRGEIYLHSKEAAKEFYEKLGSEKIPMNGISNKRGCNRLYLPPMAKEPLSKMNGGL